MIVFLVVFVIVVGAAIAVFSYRHRTEKGIESGISSFRRELDALAPRQAPRAARTSRPGSAPGTGAPPADAESNDAHDPDDDGSDDAADVDDADDGDETEPTPSQSPADETHAGDDVPAPDDEVESDDAGDSAEVGDGDRPAEDLGTDDGTRAVGAERADETVTTEAVTDEADGPVEDSEESLEPREAAGADGAEAESKDQDGP